MALGLKVFLSYSEHGLCCAAMGRGGRRAPQAAGSARLPRGEAAPVRKTTSQILQSERSDPPLSAQRSNEERESGWGGGGRGSVGQGHHFLKREEMATFSRQMFKYSKYTNPEKWQSELPKLSN